MSLRSHRAPRVLRWVLLLGLLAPASALRAQEPYFVTYSHQMEEPGNLELGTKTVTGAPGGGNPFFAPTLELEYGVKTWWTSELYLDGQSTAGESSVFTGSAGKTASAP